MCQSEVYLAHYTQRQHCALLGRPQLGANVGHKGKGKTYANSSRACQEMKSENYDFSKCILADFIHNLKTHFPI